MPMTKANGIDLHYELDGDGDDTIVLINGLADDLETWVLQMEDFLDAGYQVLRIDNRGSCVWRWVARYSPNASAIG